MRPSLLRKLDENLVTARQPMQHLERAGHASHVHLVAIALGVLLVVEQHGEPAAAGVVIDVAVLPAVLHLGGLIGQLEGHLAAEVDAGTRHVDAAGQFDGEGARSRCR